MPPAAQASTGWGIWPGVGRSALRTADLFFAGAWLVGAGWFEPAHKQRMGAHALSRDCYDWMATPGEAAHEWGPCTGLVRWRAILLC